MNKIKRFLALTIIAILITFLVFIYFDYQNYLASKTVIRMGTIEELLDISFDNIYKVNVIDANDNKEAFDIEEFKTMFKDLKFKSIKEDKYSKNTNTRYYAMNENNDFYFSIIPLNENVFLIGKGYVGSLYSYDNLLFTIIN